MFQVGTSNVYLKNPEFFKSRFSMKLKVIYFKLTGKNNFEFKRIRVTWGNFFINGLTRV